MLHYLLRGPLRVNHLQHFPLLKNKKVVMRVKPGKMLAYLLREEYERGEGALGRILLDLEDDAVLTQVVERIRHLIFLESILKVARRHADQTVAVLGHRHHLLRAAHLCIAIVIAAVARALADLSMNLAALHLIFQVSVRLREGLLRSCNFIWLGA